MSDEIAADFNIAIDMVRASKAGHAYHEAWAARTALELLPPSTDLTAITLEGFDEQDEQELEIGAVEIADLVRYHGGTDVARSQRVTVVQFKYSIASADKAVRAADLASTLVKFAITDAELRAAHSAEHVERVVRYEFATNRPINDNLGLAIKAVIAGSDVDGDVSRQAGQIANALEDYPHETASLLRRLNLVGSQGSLVDAERLVSATLDITSERAGGILDWFTCDPGDTGRLFAKSVWSEPFLPEPNTGKLHIVLAPLLSASPIRRVEAWMERGGISDSRGIKARGKPFERHVRMALSEVLANNELLTKTAVAEHGLKRKGDSEEIDLLVRVGDVVLVAEVKCFVAPSEPIEKHNHLRNLDKATAQADSKRAWAEANRHRIAEALDVDADGVAALRIIPLVIINHAFGIGLERNGVPVVDLHYLRILLGCGSYQGDTRFERDFGAVYESVLLYRSQEEFEAKIVDLLGDPPPMKRFDGRTRWRHISFPTSGGSPFRIELPAVVEDAIPNALRDMPAFRAPMARRRAR